ncbi:cysteine hydrolase family protein [Acidisphaera sp. L21]|uniref:cysteine hydrolase family protein n=1 Tax=Acidisphaera sp. L21 TaxID=1641851 RepID=UPI00131CF61E|nr:cysteine hydrolase [Acidisphaera sp. L21]
MADPWLVVIDMQLVFGEPGSPWYAPCFDAVASRIAAMIPAFGERVVFTRFIPPTEITGSWVGYYEKWPFAVAAGREDRIWRIAPVFQPGAVVDTHQFSKWTPDLRRVVGETPELVLTGVSTDCCVLATALAAIEDGAQVRVVAEACGAKTPALQEVALGVMRGRGPQVVVG